MKVALVLAVLVAGVLAAGFWLVPLAVTHAPVLLGALGVVLLLAARLLPRRHRCDGYQIHCSGCRHH